MKRYILFLFMALIAGAWGMPAKAGDNFSLYFRSGAIYHELSIYTDNVGDNVCSFIGFFYLFQGNPNGNFYYQGFNYAPETRMVSIVPGAIPLATLTGNVIKSPNSNQLILSKDYKTLNVNGTIYYRVSKDEFDRAMRNSTAPAIQTVPAPNSPSLPTPPQQPLPDRHGYTKCNSCNGTGNCSSCNGRGHYFNSYAGEEMNCLVCNGTGRCGVCHGQGSIRY